MIGSGTSDHLDTKEAPGPAEIVLPDSGTMTLGRAKDNTVVIDVSTVSSKHASITVAASGVKISDVGSTNGTFVDSLQVTAGYSKPLTNGTTVIFGDEFLAKYEFVDDTTPAAAADNAPANVVEARAWIDAWKSKQ